MSVLSFGIFPTWTNVSQVLCPGTVQGLGSGLNFQHTCDTPPCSDWLLSCASTGDVHGFSLGWSKWFWNLFKTQFWIQTQLQGCKFGQVQQWVPAPVWSWSVLIDFPGGIMMQNPFFTPGISSAQSLCDYFLCQLSGHSRVNWSTKYLWGWWRIKYLTQIAQRNSCYPGLWREKQGGERELFIFLPLRSTLNNSPTSLWGRDKIIRTKMSEQSTGAPLFTAKAKSLTNRSELAFQTPISGNFELTAPVPLLL